MDTYTYIELYTMHSARLDNCNVHYMHLYIITVTAWLNMHVAIANSIANLVILHSLRSYPQYITGTALH